MPAAYTFGSVPSPYWKTSTKAVRDPRGGPLPLATRFFGPSEVPRILARESCSCSGVIGLIVMEVYRTSDSAALPAGVLDLWYAWLLQIARTRYFTSKPLRVNCWARVSNSSGCEAGLSSLRLSTGLTRPRPKNCDQTRLTIALAK